jgi:hypothetical protein
MEKIAVAMVAARKAMLDCKTQVETVRLKRKEVPPRPIMICGEIWTACISRLLLSLIFPLISRGEAAMREARTPPITLNMSPHSVAAVATSMSTAYGASFGYAQVKLRIRACTAPIKNP